MDRRKYLVLVGGMTAVGGIASAQDDANEDGEEDEGSVQEIGDDELYLISTPDELETLPFDPNITAELEGEGSRVTDEFELDSGLAMFVYGSENVDNVGLEANLEQTDGGDSATWVILEIVFSDESIEEVTGGSLETVDGGSYLLDVDTDGEWTIHIAQPQTPEEEIRSPPVSVEGEDSAIVGPIEADNGLTVAGEHYDENSNNTFDVVVFQEDSEGILDMDFAFTEDSGFEGESRVDVDGVSWAYITTRGEWSLEFSD